MPVCFGKFSDTWLLRLFAALLTVIALCHLSTVQFYPAPWLDEVQLLENGRIAIFDNGADWSVLMTPESIGAGAKPSMYPTYIGGAVAELVYRVTGVWWAHRVFSVLGLIAATLLCFRWLKKKEFSTLIAGYVALLFCTDIHITKSAHFYRPDLWVLALAFLCALRISGLAHRSPRSLCMEFAGIGSLMAIQLLVWFAAIFSWPLLVAEFIVLAKQQSWSAKDYCRRIGYLVAGGSAVLLIFLIIPFYSEMAAVAHSLLRHPDIVALQQPSQTFGFLQGIQCFVTQYRTHILDFGVLLAREPFFWLLAILGVTMRLKKNWVFGFCFLMACIIIVAPRVYCFRVVYLLPFCAYFAATCLDKWLMQLESRSGMRQLILSLCTMVLLLGTGLCAVGLNLVAASGACGKERALLTEEMGNVIGKGAKSVYIFSWQPYFIGRDLGWRLFSFLPDNRKYIFDPKAARFLAQMEYLLVQEPSAGMVEDNGRAPLTDNERSYLLEKGFSPVAKIDVPSYTGSARMARFRYYISAFEYPSFTVWKNCRRSM